MGERRHGVDSAEFARDFCLAIQAGPRAAAPKHPDGEGLQRGGPDVSAISCEMSKLVKQRARSLGPRPR